MPYCHKDALRLACMLRSQARQLVNAINNDTSRSQFNGHPFPGFLVTQGKIALLHLVPLVNPVTGVHYRPQFAIYKYAVLLSPNQTTAPPRRSTPSKCNESMAAASVPTTAVGTHAAVVSGGVTTSTATDVVAAAVPTTVPTPASAGVPAKDDVRYAQVEEDKPLPDQGAAFFAMVACAAWDLHRFLRLIDTHYGQPHTRLKQWTAPASGTSTIL